MAVTNQTNARRRTMPACPLLSPGGHSDQSSSSALPGTRIWKARDDEGTYVRRIPAPGTHFPLPLARSRRRDLQLLRPSLVSLVADSGSRNLATCIPFRITHPLGLGSTFNTRPGPRSHESQAIIMWQQVGSLLTVVLTLAVIDGTFCLSHATYILLLTDRCIDTLWPGCSHSLLATFTRIHLPPSLSL